MSFHSVRHPELYKDEPSYYAPISFDEWQLKNLKEMECVTCGDENVNAIIPTDEWYLCPKCQELDD